MPRNIFDIILELFPEYNFTVDLPERCVGDNTKY